MTSIVRTHTTINIVNFVCKVTRVYFDQRINYFYPKIFPGVEGCAPQSEQPKHIIVHWSSHILVGNNPLISRKIAWINLSQIRFKGLDFTQPQGAYTNCKFLYFSSDL